MRMAIWPEVVNAEEVSSTIKPVTQTALVDVKSASRNEMGCVQAFGSIKNPEPIMMMSKKLKTKSRDGGISNDIIFDRNLLLSEKIINIEITINGISPEKYKSDANTEMNSR